ncbi:hypothetical protein NVV24_13340 [Acinetobacter radioresistens]|uniref:hypothetical protein n=1 Tax=Acinetobacter radioresistens TaxID=40216 RepID=UPI0022460DCE|nr:hypothetical protein [Acinetobacter radioresistens]MCX0343623.1 hypothetical protein [Acinetobacter radioresistens]
MSNKDFIALGFKEFSYHTVGNSVSYNLGRRRYLSAVCIGQGNEALFLCEKSEVGNYYTDLVCIHNRDYDGLITLEKVKALIGWFGGAEEEKGGLIMDEKFIALTQEWHTKGWNARQSEIDELKAQLECCRRENAVLLGKVGDGEKRVSELNQWNSNQYELIKRNESHTQSLKHLLQKLIDDDYTTMRPSMAYEIQEILRGAND